MPNKFSVVNDALSNTSNNLASVADQTLPAYDENDPENTASYEWDRASRTYDRELPILLERHPWPFAKATEALTQAAEADNPSNRYEYAYNWPTGALWLQKVEIPGGAPLDYEIIGRFICIDYDGEDADAPVASFIERPPASSVSNLFWECLRGKVEVGILRSINEDFSEATRRDSLVEQMMLPLVRTRTDQQTPARRAFRSTMLERRRGGGGPRAL